MTIAFENQVAIMTGAVRGLAGAMAQALAQRGAKVIFADLGDGAEVAAEAVLTETEGFSLSGEALSPEGMAAGSEEISDRSTAREIMSGFEQADKLAAFAVRRTVLVKPDNPSAMNGG